MWVPPSASTLLLTDRHPVQFLTCRLGISPKPAGHGRNFGRNFGRSLGKDLSKHPGEVPLSFAGFSAKLSAAFQETFERGRPWTENHLPHRKLF
jgi:hypothetical protein